MCAWRLVPSPKAIGRDAHLTSRTLQVPGAASIRAEIWTLRGWLIAQRDGIVTGRPAAEDNSALQLPQRINLPDEKSLP
jgi:hypothetical protein